MLLWHILKTGHLDESSPGPGKSPSDGGHMDAGCEEATSNDRPIGSSETTATNFGELPPNNSHSSDYTGKGKFASAMPIINTDDVFSECSHNEQSSQCGSHDLDSKGLVWHHSEDLQHGQANISQGHVLGKFHNLVEDNLSPQQEFIFGNFGSCTHAHNWASFWPFQLKGFPVSFNAPSASLDVQIQKLMSLFATGSGGISAELAEGVGPIHPGGVPSPWILFISMEGT